MSNPGSLFSGTNTKIITTDFRSVQALIFLKLAGEGIVFFFVIRAIITCMLSLFAFDWIEVAGVANVNALIKYPLLAFHKASTYLFLQLTREIGIWPDGRN
jgi:hypothetical protein